LTKIINNQKIVIFGFVFVLGEKVKILSLPTFVLQASENLVEPLEKFGTSPKDALLTF